MLKAVRIRKTVKKNLPLKKHLGPFEFHLLCSVIDRHSENLFLAFDCKSKSLKRLKVKSLQLDEFREVNFEISDMQIAQNQKELYLVQKFDKLIHVFDLVTEKVVNRIRLININIHTFQFDSLTTDSIIINCNKKGLIRYNLQSKTVTYQGIKGLIQSDSGTMCISHDKRLLYAIGKQKLTCRLSLKRGFKILFIKQGTEPMEVKSLALSRDNNNLFSGLSLSQIHVTDSRTWKLSRIIQFNQKGSITKIKSNGGLVILASLIKGLCIFRDRSPFEVLYFKRCGLFVSHIDFSSKMILAGGMRNQPMHLYLNPFNTHHHTEKDKVKTVKKI